MNVKAIDRQIAATERALKLGKPYTLEFTKAIRKEARDAAAELRPFKISNVDLVKADDELSGLLSYVYLVRLAALQESKTVQLSAYSNEIRAIGRDLNLNLGKLSKVLKKTAGRRNRDSLHEVRKRVNATLRETAGRGLAKAKRIAEIEAQLKSMGVSPISPSYVDTIVTSHILLARNAAYKLHIDNNDGVTYLKYVTVGDDKVRPNHQKLEGLVKRKSHPVWSSIFPPNGWNCRCEVETLQGQKVKETRLPTRAAELPDPDFRFDPRELSGF